jgi:hypothetical protein
LSVFHRLNRQRIAHERGLLTAQQLGDRRSLVIGLARGAHR